VNATVPLPMTPGRRVILALGLPIALAVIGLGVAGWASGALTGLTRQVSYQVAVSVPVKGSVASVTADNADVTLGSGTGDRIRVRGTLSGSLARPTFSWRSTAAGLALHSQCRVPAGTCSLRYAITAPARFPVAVTDSSGNMSASGLRGTVTLSDSSGDLGASGLAGSVRLDDNSGDITASGITASGLTGGIRLDNSFGDITASALTGDLRFQDNSGNVVVNGLAAADVVGVNSSGDITLTFTKVPERVQVTDSSGNITLVLPPGATAYHVIPSNSSGNTAITVPRSSSSKHVIIVANQSGDITVTR
jgi:Putative adhesin